MVANASLLVSPLLLVLFTLIRDLLFYNNRFSSVICSFG